MVLLAGSCLLLTRVSVDGSFLDDLLVPLALFGAGLGATFVASQIAGLAGVAEEESGLAAGLVDSSFNIGSALGIAVLSTVALSRTEDALATDQATAPSLAMTEGFQSAFLVAVAIAVLGGLLALLLFRRRQEAEDGVIEAPLALEVATAPPCGSRGLPASIMPIAEVAPESEPSSNRAP